MKLPLKSSLKSRKLYVVLASLCSVLIIVAGSLSIYNNRAKAAADLNASLNLGSLPGAFSFHQNGTPYCPPASLKFCLTGNTYLEISQKDASGVEVGLDAAETWTKSYIEPNRLNSAVIGVYDGHYDGRGVDYNAAQRSGVTDDDATTFEFYIGVDSQRGDLNWDEDVCRSQGSPKRFALRTSKQMAKNGWSTIRPADFMNENASCNRNGQWLATQKTNRIVIFTKASWRDQNNKQGRINAFRVSMAYTDTNDVANNAGATGYWSRFATATNPGQNFTSGQYAVQDRVNAVNSPNTQGEYFFKFAPDCHIAKDEYDKTTRYIKWYDVDYPDYYQAAGMGAPRFKLVDTTTGQTVVERTGSELGGTNGYGEFGFRAQGGHTYEWHWYNIAARDGIVFWIPYDDFPALVGGCGQYQHELKMKAGALGQGLQDNPDQDIPIAGGQTATVNLSQFFKGTDAGPKSDVQLTISAASGRTIDASFTRSSTATLGGTNNNGLGASRAFNWDDLGRLGPAPTYPFSRNDIYAYLPVKDDAPDGARYCVTASMTPGSSTNSGSIPSSPRQLCFRIDNSLKPYLSTSGGDVHAGNNCVITGLPNNGKITGQRVEGVANGSSGSYIVSAGDIISSFGSGGIPSGSSLSFGKGGKYGSICRPKIDESDITKAIQAGAKWATSQHGVSTYNLNSLDTSERGRQYVVKLLPGGTVSGTSKRSVTIYSTGDITISGNLAGDTTAPYAKSELPVVGVVAGGGIKINPNVTQINATLYALGHIDTCAVSNWVAQCKSLLTINGFAMGKSFSFKRVSAASNGLQKGEQINFNAAFYLNPPPGMGTAAGTVKYLGERAPLY